MLKNKKQNEDDIQLIELFMIFWKYKITFALLMVIGLILGVAFSYQQVTRYETLFNVILGHPAYKDSLLLSSSNFQNLLSERELNPRKMPRLSIQKSNTEGMVTLKIESLSPLNHEEIRMKFKKIIAAELEQQKSYAFIEMDKTKNFFVRGELSSSLPASVLSTIPVDEILRKYSINFSSSQKVGPNPIKYGILGMSVGLLLAGCWMVLSLFFRAIQRRMP